MHRFWILGLLYMLVSLSCQHKPAEVITPPQNIDTSGNPKQPCDSTVVYFGRDVLPILNTNCAMSGCHDAGTASDGIVLNSYNNVINTGRIVPFDLNSSDLYEVIIEDKPDKRMPPPPKSALNATQIALIAKWINQGAKNLICEEQNCDTINISYGNMIAKTMATYCIGCHGANYPGAGLNLTNYAGMSAIAANGRLIGSITHIAGYKAMPQGGKLPSCEIKQIQKWVAMGFPNN